MNVKSRFVLFSHALVNKLGEKGWVGHELALSRPLMSAF
jgi:hypothetical protein